MLTGSTFNATVSGFTAVQNPNISTAGMVERFGFTANGRALVPLSQIRTILCVQRFAILC